MRVKIFVRSEGYTSYPAEVSSLLEQDVSAWLESHPSVRVSETRQALFRSGAEPARHLIAIWYSPDSR